MNTIGETKSPTFTRWLVKAEACSEAVEWVGDKTLAEAWATCPRADWMFWLLARSDGWLRTALNECCIEFATMALEWARPVAGKKVYWAAVASAHQQVVAAIRSGVRLAAARDAAWAAPPPRGGRGRPGSDRVHRRRPPRPRGRRQGRGGGGPGGRRWTTGAA